MEPRNSDHWCKILDIFDVVIVWSVRHVGYMEARSVTFHAGNGRNLSHLTGRKRVAQLTRAYKELTSSKRSPGTQ